MNTGGKLWSSICSIIVLAAAIGHNPFLALAALPNADSHVFMPAPVRIYPEHQAYIGAEQITFAWEPVPGATRYRFELLRADGNPRGTLDVWTWRTSFTATDLQPNVTYYWCVHAISHSGKEGQPCYRYREVTTSSEPLAPTAPPAVFAGEGRYHDRVRLYWQAAQRAVYYHVERARPGEQIRTRVGTTSDITFEDFVVVPGERYEYTVLACNEVGCSDPSPADLGWAGQCSIMGRPEPEQPKGRLLFVPTSQLVELSWTTVEQAREYEYQLERPHAQSEADLENGGSHLTSVQVLVDQPGTYRWRVRALDPAIGCPPGPWSQVSAFRLVEAERFTSFTLK
jgi:hypothetical protein